MTPPKSPKQGANRGNAGRGRPKGSRNKTTASVKEALTRAFDEMGGWEELQRWGKNNQAAFYGLWAKMLPTEVSGPDGGPIDVRAVVILPPLLPE